MRNMARPAFAQNVVYEVKSFPTTVTFRSVQLEILGIDNNSITYRMLKGF